MVKPKRSGTVHRQTTRLRVSSAPVRLPAKTAPSSTAMVRTKTTLQSIPSH